MLLKVPFFKSLFGWGTVTRPFLVLCLNCTWEPFRATSNQPFLFSFLMTSRLFTALSRFLYTPYTPNTINNVYSCV